MNPDTIEKIIAEYKEKHGIREELAGWLRTTLTSLATQERERGREEIWKKFQPFLAKYSIDRPIPPSDLRELLGEFDSARGENNV